MTIGPVVELHTDQVTHQARLHAPRTRASIAHSGMLLSVGAGLVGVISYGVTLLMANALKPADFSQFAAAQTMLGMVGIVTTALVPLPLAHAVASHPPGSEHRRDAMAFAMLVSGVMGVLAALITGILAAGLGSASTAAFIALAAFVLFIGAAPSGWLQGELRFVRYTLKSVGEVFIRMVFSVLVAVFAWGAPGAILGFAVGGLALLVTPWAFVKDLAWRPYVLRERWRWAETGDIALTLCAVSVLVGLDVVLVAFLDGGTTEAAGFQAIASIAKAPVYVAAGTVLVVFPILRRADVAVATVLTDALRSFGQLALVACAVIATVPHMLVDLVMPDQYDPSFVLLPWLAISGLGYATLTVLATILLALRAYRRCQLGLAAASALVLSGLFGGWAVGGVPGIAIGCAVGAVAAACTLVVITAPYLPRHSAKMAANGVAAAALLTVLLKMSANQVAVWLVVVFITGLLMLAELSKKSSTRLFRRLGTTLRAKGGTTDPLRRRRGRHAADPAVEAADVLLKDRAVPVLQNQSRVLRHFVIHFVIALGVRATVSHLARSTRSR